MMASNIEMELCDCSLADIKKPVGPDHAVRLVLRDS
jgi:hypothetical protein